MIGFRIWKLFSMILIGFRVWKFLFDFQVFVFESYSRIDGFFRMKVFVFQIFRFSYFSRILMGFCILIDKCSSLNAGALLDSSTVLTVEKSSWRAVSFYKHDGRRLWNLLNFRISSFYKKIGWPLRRIPSFHKYQNVSKSIFPRYMDRLMLQHSINETPLGASFHKQGNPIGSFYKGIRFIKC